MKKLLVSLIALCLAFSVNANDYKYLSFELADGSVQSLSVTDLTLTFSNGNLVSSDGTTIPLANLTKMFFSETSGIATLPFTTGTGKVEVYNPSGSKVGVFGNMQEAKSKLPKGIYIIKDEQGNKQKTAIQ